MHTGFYWEKLESNRPLGRPGHRGKVLLNICNRPAFLGFPDVVRPTTMQISLNRYESFEGTFFRRQYFGKSLDVLRWITADININFISWNTQSTIWMNANLMLSSKKLSFFLCTLLIRWPIKFVLYYELLRWKPTPCLVLLVGALNRWILHVQKKPALTSTPPN